MHINTSATGGGTCGWTTTGHTGASTGRSTISSSGYVAIDAVGGQLSHWGRTGRYVGQAKDRFLVCDEFARGGDYVPANCVKANSQPVGYEDHDTLRQCPEACFEEPRPQY